MTTRSVELEPGIRLLRAPNPSPLTADGTNTYIVGTGDVAIIDPGPWAGAADDAHLAAILGALQPGERISHILVTHSHLDHSPLARPLSKATGALIHAFGPSDAGRSAMMQKLAQTGDLGGGEGTDHDFSPDVTLADGEIIEGGNWRIEALWTPGHFGNHLAFAAGDALFSGDLVMGWATTLVSPPDGDLTEFMASCRRLAKRRDRIFYPGHGAPIEAPQERTNWLIAHRQEREAQILGAMEQGIETIPEITRRVYTDIAPTLLPAAQRNVLAHLVDLVSTSRATSTGTLGPAARFRLP